MSNDVTELCRPLALPPTLKAVLMALADYCHKDGKDWHSVAALMQWTCLGKTTVIDALKGLETRGLIHIDRRRGAKSTTFLLLDALKAEPNQCATRTGSESHPRRNRNGSRTGTGGVPVRVADSTGARGVQTGAAPVQTGAGGAPEALEALEALEASEKHQGCGPDGPGGPGRTNAVWLTYSEAFTRRYGIAPTRNAKVNAQLANLIKLVGAEQATKLAAAYLGSTNKFYLERKHPLDLLLRDVDRLRVEMSGNGRPAAGPSGAAQARIDRNIETALRCLEPKP